MGFWDDKRPNTGTWMKFVDIGDTITGTVTDLDVEPSKLDDREHVVVTLDTTDGERKVAASTIDLAQKLYDARPDLGDTLTITFTGTEKRGAGEAKLFDVTVTRATKAKAKPAPQPNTDDEEVF